MGRGAWMEQGFWWANITFKRFTELEITKVSLRKRAWKYFKLYSSELSSWNASETECLLNYHLNRGQLNFLKLTTQIVAFEYFCYIIFSRILLEITTATPYKRTSLLNEFVQDMSVFSQQCGHRRRACALSCTATFLSLRLVSMPRLPA